MRCSASNSTAPTTPAPSWIRAISGRSARSTWCSTSSAARSSNGRPNWSAQPLDGRAVFFVVEPNRAQLAELAERVRTGRLTPVVGAVFPLSETATTFAPARRTPGKTVIQVVPSQPK
ncbi:zinc-binding dehydrogenase [Herbidospora solisilvae]|uniref:zinc-binding dehydrogenase n=1 Tax=Herbidospora solisilvae TaxID=2696284 RepID=UPI001929FB4E|nr:zinc-binding dehydrogenase [Herbidospora solisilvae]